MGSASAERSELEMRSVRWYVAPMSDLTVGTPVRWLNDPEMTGRVVEPPEDEASLMGATGDAWVWVEWDGSIRGAEALRPSELERLPT